MATIKSLQDQRYIVLETYRKTGVPVPTPVGFVQDGETLLVRTEATAGKAKRMRANPHVRIAPSTARGEPLGDWQHATATELPPAEAMAARKQFLARYGLIWWSLELGLSLFRRFRKGGSGEWTVFRLTLASAPEQHP